MLVQDNVRKLDIKQNAFYDKRARSRKFDAGMWDLLSHTGISGLAKFSYGII